MYNASGDKITDVNDIESTQYLSTEHTSLPWLCRVRRSASLVLLRLTVIIICKYDCILGMKYSFNGGYALQTSYV